MRGIIVIFIIALLIAGCSKETEIKECTLAADCKDSLHVDCAGEWSCDNSKCAWQCTEIDSELIGEPTVDNITVGINDIGELEQELDFSELEMLEQDLGDLYW